VLLPRSRRAPKRFPEEQWTRSVAKMANINKADVANADSVTKQHERPRVVLTHRIVVGRIRKNLSPPLSRTRKAGRGASMTAEQRAKEIVQALQALYTRRVRKGKWRTERANNGSLCLPKAEPSAGENDVNNDSVDLQPCGLQAEVSRDRDIANESLCEAQRAARDFRIPAGLCEIPADLCGIPADLCGCKQLHVVITMRQFPISVQQSNTLVAIRGRNQ
jgi:hypothetical protein